MKFIANTISVIFHPLLMALYTSLILVYVYDLLPLRDVRYQYLLFGIIFLFSFLLPSAFILILFRLKLISNITLTKQEERTLPYFFTAIFYAFVAYLLHNKSFIDPLIYNILFLGSVVIIMTAVINLKLKISAHAVSIAAILGMLVHLSFNYDAQTQLIMLNVVILITGLVCSARLYLKAHDFFEVVSGLSLGLFIGIIAPFFIL